jgi:hypothetical protein
MPEPIIHIEHLPMAMTVHVRLDAILLRGTLVRS